MMDTYVRGKGKFHNMGKEERVSSSHFLKMNGAADDNHAANPKDQGFFLIYIFIFIFYSSMKSGTSV